MRSKEEREEMKRFAALMKKVGRTYRVEKKQKVSKKQYVSK
ncbi:hypothetical protein [Paenibacillus profundus]|nr:hypothetical protein [Paenibacillus profundus]